jgi:hypothetical protein
MGKRNTIDSFDRSGDITPEEVRQFEKFKNYTDEQVNNMIDTIKRLTNIAFNLYQKDKKFGKVIVLDSIDNQTLKAA